MYKILFYLGTRLKDKPIKIYWRA